MKKLLLILFVFLLTACTNSVKPVQVSVEVEENFNVYVDPRIELITVIQYLGDYFRISKLDMEYKDEISEYFSDYKDHSAVTEFKRLSQYGFSYDAPITLMLSTTLPEFEVNYNAPTDVVKRIGGFNNVEKFLGYVKDFYEVSNFSKFFNDHEEFYNNIVDNYSSEIDDRILIQKLETYFGMSQNSYSIILSTLLHSGGYGSTIIDENNNYDTYSIIGPKRVVDAGVIFEYSDYITLHEFGHSFVNPISDNYKTEIMSYSSLFDPIEEKMTSMAYGHWIITINEHIIRAVVARMLLDLKDNVTYDNVVEYEKKRDFIYIDHILEQLIIYENNRDEYKSFDEFYPELINSFDSIT